MAQVEQAFKNSLSLITVLPPLRIFPSIFSFSHFVDGIYVTYTNSSYFGMIALQFSFQLVRICWFSFTMKIKSEKILKSAGLSTLLHDNAPYMTSISVTAFACRFFIIFFVSVLHLEINLNIVIQNFFAIKEEKYIIFIFY